MLSLAQNLKIKNLLVFIQPCPWGETLKILCCGGQIFHQPKEKLSPPDWVSWWILVLRIWCVLYGNCGHKFMKGDLQNFILTLEA